MKALAPALFASILVLGVCALAFGGLASGANGLDFALLGDPYVQHALSFTLVQASLSTVLSLGLGALFALALARRQFALRGLVVSALGAVFVLPSIVAVVSILTLYGRAGFAKGMTLYFARHDGQARTSDTEGYTSNWPASGSPASRARNVSAAAIAAPALSPATATGRPHARTSCSTAQQSSSPTGNRCSGASR